MVSLKITARCSHAPGRMEGRSPLAVAVKLSRLSSDVCVDSAGPTLPTHWRTGGIILL
jgi:hypothetical protein